MKALLIVISLAGLLVTPVIAGHCRRSRIVVQNRHAQVATVHSAYVPVQQIYAVQPIYQIGSALREEAVAQRAAELALKSLVQQLQANPMAQQQLGQPCPPEDGAPPTNGDARAQQLFNQHCLRCHSGAAPRAGLDLSDVRQLDNAMRMKAAVFTFRGVMPPEGGALSSDEDATFLLDWASGISK